MFSLAHTQAIEMAGAQNNLKTIQGICLERSNIACSATISPETDQFKGWESMGKYGAPSLRFPMIFHGFLKPSSEKRGKKLFIGVKSE